MYSAKCLLGRHVSERQVCWLDVQDSCRNGVTTGIFPGLEEGPVKLQTVSKLCSGCRACLLVCSLTNHGLNNPRYGAINVIQHFPSPGTYELKVCIECGVCKDVCPTGAIKENSEGILFVDEAECIGCEVCVDACPEQVMRFIKEKNVAFKCVSCGECVKYCPREALVDESGEVHRV